MTFKMRAFILNKTKIKPHKMIQKHLLTIAIAATLMLGAQGAMAQETAINNSGAAANASAILDVSSTTQGMLVPRMTASQRGTLGSPATGLLVYQTDGTTGFYYWNGSAWVNITNSATTAGGDLTGSYPNPTVANLGAISGANLTNLTPGNLTSGGTFPAENGSNLTNLNASNLASGTVAASVGGTGNTSYTVGDLLYASATTALSKLNAAASGKVLTSNGAGVAPSWQTPSGGGGASYLFASIAGNNINASWYVAPSGASTGTNNNASFEQYFPTAVTVDQIDYLMYDAGGSVSSGTVTVSLKYATPTNAQANSWTTAATVHSYTRSATLATYTNTISPGVVIPAGSMVQYQIDQPGGGLSCGLCHTQITTKYH